MLLKSYRGCSLLCSQPTGPACLPFCLLGALPTHFLAHMLTPPSSMGSSCTGLLLAPKSGSLYMFPVSGRFLSPSGSDSHGPQRPLLCRRPMDLRLHFSSDHAPVAVDCIIVRGPSCTVPGLLSLYSYLQAQHLTLSGASASKG